jgi:aspartyl-tRNA(Asn)/glutamyl-tRNA(Gln) amidotransferase subunit A
VGALRKGPRDSGDVPPTRTPEAPLSSLEEIVERIRSRQVSPVELTEAALERAETVGRDLHAFVTIDRRGALAAARRAEALLEKGARTGALHGVPITIKDLVRTRGMPTTAGSRALGPETGSGLPGDRDAPLVRRLRRAGAILIGKTNLNEFAYGVTGENAWLGDVVNPWDAGHMTGGSSSGSAVAVAVGAGCLSVGTDTRGSIRIPASCCGITGHKPTRGLVPTGDVFPLSWTLDHSGPMGRSARDVALMLGVMAGGRGGARGLAEMGRDPKGLRLGLPSFFFEDLDPEVEASVRAAVDVLADLGLEPREIDVPELQGALRPSAVIASAEALAVHEERLRDRRTDYGQAVLGRLEKGYALSALDLARAELARQGLVHAYERAFREVDCMVGPTLPGLPAAVGSDVMRVGGGREEWIVDASCRLVAPQNMTGTPAISVPCGLSRSGLPIGLQIWAATGRDALVLGVADRYQARTDWHTRPPPLAELHA